MSTPKTGLTPDRVAKLQEPYATVVAVAMHYAAFIDPDADPETTAILAAEPHVADLIRADLAVIRGWQEAVRTVGQFFDRAGWEAREKALPRPAPENLREVIVILVLRGMLREAIFALEDTAERLADEQWAEEASA